MHTQIRVPHSPLSHRHTCHEYMHTKIQIPDTHTQQQQHTHRRAHTGILRHTKPGTKSPPGKCTHKHTYQHRGPWALASSCRTVCKHRHYGRTHRLQPQRTDTHMHSHTDKFAWGHPSLKMAMGKCIMWVLARGWVVLLPEA